VKIICPEHGEFEQKPYIHLTGKNGCKICDNNRKKELYKLDTYEFIERSKKIHNNKYDYSLVEYGDNNNQLVKIICLEHGVFEQKPYIHLLGSGCKYCKNSKGESKIMDILKVNNLDYIKEKRFHKCKDKISLPFDFYLPNENVYIEYFGLIKNIGWQKNEVLFNYLDKMRKKVLFCEERGYNLIYGETPKKIINKLKSIIWK